MFIPVIYFKTGQLSLEAGTLNKIGKTDYRRDRKGMIDRMYHSQTILQYLGLALENQNYCSPNLADVDRLVVLI